MSDIRLTQDDHAWCGDVEGVTIQDHIAMLKKLSRQYYEDVLSYTRMKYLQGLKAEDRKRAERLQLVKRDKK